MTQPIRITLRHVNRVAIALPHEDFIILCAAMRMTQRAFPSTSGARFVEAATKFEGKTSIRKT